MQKPSKETIAKHIAKAKSLAKKNGGKLPSYTWLNKHGFFGTYEILRQFTENFAGIARVDKRATVAAKRKH
jgi:hypothetical protein